MSQDFEKFVELNKQYVDEELRMAVRDVTDVIKKNSSSKGNSFKLDGKTTEKGVSAVLAVVKAVHNGDSGTGIAVSVMSGVGEVAFAVGGPIGMAVGAVLLLTSGLVSIFCPSKQGADPFPLIEKSLAKILEKLGSLETTQAEIFNAVGDLKHGDLDFQNFDSFYDDVKSKLRELRQSYHGSDFQNVTSLSNILGASTYAKQELTDLMAKFEGVYLKDYSFRSPSKWKRLEEHLESRKPVHKVCGWMEEMLIFHKYVGLNIKIFEMDLLRATLADIVGKPRLPEQWQHAVREYFDTIQSLQNGMDERLKAYGGVPGWDDGRCTSLMYLIQDRENVELGKKSIVNWFRDNNSCLNTLHMESILVNNVLLHNIDRFMLGAWLAFPHYDKNVLVSVVSPEIRRVLKGIDQGLFFNLKNRLTHKTLDAFDCQTWLRCTGPRLDNYCHQWHLERKSERDVFLLKNRSVKSDGHWVTGVLVAFENIESLQIHSMQLGDALSLKLKIPHSNRILGVSKEVPEFVVVVEDSNDTSGWWEVIPVQPKNENH